MRTKLIVMTVSIFFFIGFADMGSETVTWSSLKGEESPAIASAEAAVADGFYLCTADVTAPVVGIQDGQELYLGKKCALEIKKAELTAQDNANTRFYLYLTVPYEADLENPSHVLVVGGTVYRQSSSGSSQNKSSSLGFYISGQEQAKC
ncbi:MAG: hypothetical protein PHT33_09050 [bacterium]|nr:hypothetical protein [bacterium]